MTTFAPPQPSQPAPNPPPLTQAGRSALRAVIVIVASALIVGCVVALGAAAWTISSVRVAVDEKSLPGNMRSLFIDTGDTSAAIRLTTDRDAREPTASMRIVNASGAGEHSLVVTQEASATRLAVAGGLSRFMDWGHGSEITVTLPPELARRLSVNVTQDDGVLMALADVDELVARNNDGAVLLRGSARRVDIRTQDGNIFGRERLSVIESFDAQSVDGSISVEFADVAPRKIDVGTVDGSIAISLPAPGPYLVRASANSPQIRVPETNDLARAAAEVTLQSDDGSVVVDTRGRG